MSRRNENRPGYKQTRVGWIPEEWGIKKGDEISTLITKGSSPKWQGFTYQNNGVLFITSENVRNGFLDISIQKYLPKEFNEKQRSSILRYGDILINIVGASIGRACKYHLSDTSANINQAVCLLRPNKEVDSNFISYYLQHPLAVRRLLSTQVDSARPNLTLSDIRTFCFVAPPLPEQKKIAEILSAWDRAIGRVGKLIDAKQRLKKGLMQKLLTGRMRFPEFDHGIHGIHGKKKSELPEGWKNKTLGSFGLFSKGKGISNSEKKGTGFPCITYGEIYTRHEFVIKEFHSFIDKDTAQKSQRIQKGDIIFAGSGETLDEIGKCVAYTQDEEAYAGGDIIIFRPKGVDSVYLSYLLNSDLLIRQKRKLGQGYSVVHIYSSGLKILHVPLPSLPEQTRIAAVLSTCDREIELLRRKEIALREQKKGLMQKLLTGEVRVKLNGGVE